MDVDLYIDTVTHAYVTFARMCLNTSEDILILRHYLTSHNGNDMLTLFAGGPGSRKFDNWKKRVSS